MSAPKKKTVALSAGVSIDVLLAVLPSVLVRYVPAKRHAEATRLIWSLIPRTTRLALVRRRPYLRPLQAPSKRTTAR